MNTTTLWCLYVVCTHSSIFVVPSISVSVYLRIGKWKKPLLSVSQNKRHHPRKIVLPYLYTRWRMGWSNRVRSIFFLLNKIVCYVLCVTSFPFVIFPLTYSFLIHKLLTRDSHQFTLFKEYLTKSVGPGQFSAITYESISKNTWLTIRVNSGFSNNISPNLLGLSDFPQNN